MHITASEFQVANPISTKDGEENSLKIDYHSSFNQEMYLNAGNHPNLQRLDLSKFNTYHAKT